MWMVFSTGYATSRKKAAGQALWQFKHHGAALAQNRWIQEQNMRRNNDADPVILDPRTSPILLKNLVEELLYCTARVLSPVYGELF
jgi:hypothetical protein